MLAEAGLTTLAWNPYPGLAWGEPFAGRPPRPDDEETVASLSACIDFMLDALDLRTVGTLGFCMGGRFVLLHGQRDHRMSAIVSAYPSLPGPLKPGQTLDPISAARDITCPVQVIYPGKDSVTPRPVFLELQTTLHERDAESAIVVFPNAGHGFLHDHNDVNDAAARVAVPQISSFLRIHLTASVSTKGFP